MALVNVPLGPYCFQACNHPLGSQANEQNAEFANSYQFDFRADHAPRRNSHSGGGPSLETNAAVFVRMAGLAGLRGGIRVLHQDDRSTTAVCIIVLATGNANRRTLLS